MIVLDTNVVSELMRNAADPTVLAWTDTQEASDLFLTAITVAELWYGVWRLPDGRRRSGLGDQLAAMLAEDFRGRVLTFDEAAAGEYAALVTARERAGEPIAMADAQIAAVCRVHGAVLATRNVTDFRDSGVALVDPWQPSG